MSLADTIQTKLEAAFAPVRLEVINESHKHAGHAGDDGSGESHFRLYMVSEAFAGKSRIERQRQVFSALAEEMTIIHALSLTLKTKDEDNNTP